MWAKARSFNWTDAQETADAVDTFVNRLSVREDLSNLLVLVVPSCFIMVTAWILTLIESRVDHRSINILLIIFGTVGYALVTVIAMKLIQMSITIF